MGMIIRVSFLILSVVGLVVLVVVSDEYYCGYAEVTQKTSVWSLSDRLTHSALSDISRKPEGRDTRQRVIAEAPRRAQKTVF